MNVITSWVASLAMLAFAGNAFAQADQILYPVGGPGGGEFYARCAEGELLNGFELRVGDDVDAIRAICVRALSPKGIFPRRAHPDMAGGPGGHVIQVVCPDRHP